MPVDAVTSTSSSNSNVRSVSSSYRPAPTLEAARQGNCIQRGQEGASVRDLQRQLNAAGAQPPLAEDGDFGAKTDAAVRRFQATAGLKVDGLVGPKTVQALQNGNSVEGETTRRNRTTATASTGNTTATTAPQDPPRTTRPLTTTRGLADAGAPTAAPTTEPAAVPTSGEAASPASNPTLRRGATGAAVVELQKKLGIDDDGKFGQNTEKAVRNFQREHGLDDDGVVGPKTWNALNGIEEPAGTGPTRPAGRKAIERTFGQPGDNQVTTQLPIGPGGKEVSVTLHEKLVPVMREMLEEAKQKDLLKHIKSFDGMSVYKHKNGNPNSDLSTHSWGIAFDINADSNKVNPELRALFEKHGFYWGGNFGDDMHFQYATKY